MNERECPDRKWFSLVTFIEAKNFTFLLYELWFTKFRMLCQMWLFLLFIFFFAWYSSALWNFFLCSIGFAMVFGFAVRLSLTLCIGLMHTLYVRCNSACCVVCMYACKCYVCINEFYLILMESKVIEAQQPKYLVTFTLYRVIHLMPRLLSAPATFLKNPFV